MTMTQTTLKSADPRKLTVVPEIKALVPPLSADERTALTADITEKGAILTPVLIDQNGNVLDGHNRVEIAVELGMDEIPATEVTVKDEDDAKRIAIEANLNRRHLTLQSRKRIAKELVKLTPWKSNREIAKAAGVDPKTVGAQRELMEESGEVEPQETTVGADGKARPAKATTRKSSESTESRVAEAVRAASGHVRTYIEDIEKLTTRKMGQLTAEGFVANLANKKQKEKLVGDRLPAVISFLEEVLHLLETEAEGAADAAKSNGVSAPEPGAAAPSTPEEDGAPF